MGFKDISIRKKLIFSFSSLIVLVFAGGFIAFRLLNQVTSFQQLKSDMAANMMMLDNAQNVEKEFLLYGWKEVDFLEDGESKLTKEYNQKVSSLRANLKNITNQPLVVKANLSNDISSLNLVIGNYEKTFEHLRKALYKRGFKDHGLEGELRTYVHDLQKCISPEEKVYAFSLRRHEKDFGLRKDTKYVDRLMSTADEFITFVKAAPQSRFPHMTDAYRSETIAGIEAYKSHFNKIVQIETTIGLSNKGGIRLEIDKITEDLEPKVEAIYATINNKSNQLYSRSLWVISITLLLLFTGVLLLIFVLSRSVSNPIRQLDDVITKVLKGDSTADASLKITSNDEVGNLSRNFKHMLANIRENLTMINEKNEKLEEKAKEDELRNWSIQGLAKFSDLMKHNTDDLEAFCNDIISHLVRYVNANQGALYIINEEGEIHFMEMKGCYAYNKRKYINKRIEKGEGLIGQSWLEDDYILLTEIPDAYINITSGLGTANPNCLLIMPVKTDRSVEGVIEIASFEVFTKEQIQFVEELCDRLASTISAVKMQQRTHMLLEESQQMTEEMKANEEEMRQNMEELQATQEEMNRFSNELNGKIQLLENKNFVLNHIIGKVYDGVIVTNDALQIEYINEYVEEELFYKEQETRGETPELILKTNTSKLVASITNDPNFLATGFTEQKSVKVMDRYGKITDALLIATQLQQGEKHLYVFLFNKTTFAESKSQLQRILNMKRK